MEAVVRKLREELGRIAEYTLDHTYLDNVVKIKARCEGLDVTLAKSLSLILRYLYLTDGPINLKNPQFNPAADAKLLTPGELVMARYLKSRTNGGGRKRYGARALRAARRAKYRCESCSNGDARVLVLDHANARDDVENFLVLCADCHQIKSRIFDWTGKKREAIKLAEEKS